MFVSDYAFEKWWIAHLNRSSTPHKGNKSRKTFSSALLWFMSEAIPFIFKTLWNIVKFMHSSKTKFFLSCYKMEINAAQNKKRQAEIYLLKLHIVNIASISFLLILFKINFNYTECNKASLHLKNIFHYFSLSFFLLFTFRTYTM